MGPIKAVCLFSGGLDSILAAKILESQGIDVQAVTFITPFFEDRSLGSPSSLVQTVWEKWHISLRVVDITDDYFPMLKSPPHGYGKNLNPCIDCKILMLRKAKGVMEQIGAKFIATGEVIGQRPMSQRRDTMRIIERDSGLEGLLLRPLSAKLLPETIPEKEGWVNRERLYDLSGRSRTRQMALAKEFHIEAYPSPAGGCILTDPVLSKRIEDVLNKGVEIKAEDIALCRLGRHFVWDDGTRFVVARNQAENTRLAPLAARGQALLKVKHFPGPLGLYISPHADMPWLTQAAEIICRYSKARHEKSVEVLATEVGSGREHTFTVTPRWDLEDIECRHL